MNPSSLVHNLSWGFCMPRHMRVCAFCRVVVQCPTGLKVTCMSSGAATMYGMFLAVRMALATSACLPPSMVPAGPPTRGNPMVLTTASTATASALSVALLLLLACSLVLVSKSRTCAQTQQFCLEQNVVATIVCGQQPGLSAIVIWDDTRLCYAMK